MVQLEDALRPLNHMIDPSVGAVDRAPHVQEFSNALPDLSITDLAEVIKRLHTLTNQDSFAGPAIASPHGLRLAWDHVEAELQKEHRLKESKQYIAEQEAQKQG